VGAEEFVELQDLVNRYLFIIDDAAWDRLGEIFVEDAVVDYRDVDPNEPRLEGIDQIRTYFESLDPPVAHHSTNLMCEVGANEDERLLRSKMIAALRSGKLLFGEYRDRAVRTPDGWRFAERRSIRPRAYRK
jgi:hypothetical protein